MEFLAIWLVDYVRGQVNPCSAERWKDEIPESVLKFTLQFELETASYLKSKFYQNT